MIDGHENGQMSLKMAKIGYARVSTTDQSLASQKNSLIAAGCKTIFEDKISGAKSERTGLNQALKYVRDGDTLVVWKLDRLGRSMPHLIETVMKLKSEGVGFQSLTERVDTTTSGGTLIFHIFGALAQVERDLIQERTQAGLKAAAARGRKGGRKPVMNNAKLLRTKQLIESGLNVREAAARLKIGKTSLYTALKQQKICKILQQKK